MGKTKYFSSKSVFGQLISLIDDSMIRDAVKKHDSDRYVKRFKSQDHLFSMIFCSLVKGNSLREVAGGIPHPARRQPASQPPSAEPLMAGGR